jgi:hypothetical protein
MDQDSDILKTGNEMIGTCRLQRFYGMFPKHRKGEAMPNQPISFVISVSLVTGCYRHIRISGQATLEELSDAILDAFGFYNDHMHEFFMDNRAWSDYDSYVMRTEYPEEGRYTCDYTLLEAGLYPRQKFLYIFDFGDCWRFACRVLKVLDEPAAEPQVVRSKGEPPEQYPDYDEWDEE